MKKHYLFIFALTFLSITLFAQNRQIIVGKNYTDKNNVTLIGEAPNSVTLQFDVNELNLIEVETEHGKMYTMESGKAPRLLEAGKPELLYLTAAIVLPETGSTELQIMYGAYTEIENVDIAPSKGNFARSIDPATVPYQKGEVYETNAFFPGIPAVANESFIMRDVRGQSIFAYPVQYNPVTKTLRIYSKITVTAVFNDTPGINEFTTQKKHTTLEPTFQNMYNNLFINSNTHSKDYPTTEEGELLIICHYAFEDAMKPFINWKRTIGRKTTMVSTIATGTTASDIKTYIKDYYNDPTHNLAYVLLVGDIAQMPAHTYANSSQGAPVYSDNYYGQLVGNDRYMEVLIGRMSAENIAQVQTQVQRAIWYERDITTADTWISSAICIATDEANGGHDGGENDYKHMNKIRDRMLTYGYNPVHQEYGTGTGIPPSSVQQISQRFNEGVSIANYCNHGSETAWTLSSSGSPGGAIIYSTNEVNTLTNTGKLPFIFSVACLNGRFVHTEPCFAEAWMRATHNGAPAGAVATQMATISIGWAPPMTAQDEFINICMDIPSQYSGGQPGIKRTFAGSTINAMQKMLLVHGTSNPKNTDDFDAWTVFGDPTLMLRTKNPQELIFSNAPTLILGVSTSLTIACNAQEGLAALTRIGANNEVIIIGTGVINSDGTTEIAIGSPILVPEELTLTITSKNFVTYQGTVLMKAGPEPYLIVPSYNLKANADYGQTVGVKFELKNVSTAPYNANNVVVKVTTASPFITLPQSIFEFNTIEAGNSYISENDLLVKIADNVPNNLSVALNLLISCQYEGKTYERTATIHFTTHAPTLDFKEIYIENLSGVRLNQFNANTTNTLVMLFENSGIADLFNVNVAVSTSSPHLTIPSNAVTLEILEKGKTGLAKINMNIGNSSAGTVVNVVLRASSGAFENSVVYTNTIGASPSYFMANETMSTTYADFYDTGGPNNPYSANENLKITFKPVNEGKKLQISFSEFNVETSTDNLMVYDGVAALSNALIATLTGSELPQNYKATNAEGALTFVFKSNASTQLAGWAAKIYETEVYHNVSFIIIDEYNQPVTDATITFDGYLLAKNQFKVPFVADGTYSYSVKKSGYPTVSGTVKVENGNQEVTVKLSLSSINNNGIASFYAYPNPFNNIIHIEGDASTVNKVFIDNLLGQRIATIKLQGKSSFTTEAIPDGVYYITFEKHDKTSETVKMIKR